MPSQKVKLSIKPAKLIIFFLVIAAVLAAFFLLNTGTERSDDDRSLDAEKEIILPQKTGVADSGFEKKNASFAVLNAKATYDNLEEINGAYSLKISFSDRPTASVKVGDYFNDMEEGKFYRLSFWARTGPEKEKKVGVSISEDERYQDLGEAVFPGNGNARHYEFNFRAESSANNLILTSTDGTEADVWMDDFWLESLDVGSDEQLKDIQPTVFGATSWRNVDKSQTEGDKDSEDLLSEKGNKIGQVFQPGNSSLSGAAFKIQKVGTGGEGSYKLQLREYDQKLGMISEKILATSNIYIGYPPSVSEEMEDREKQMREEFTQKEKDIREGNIPNDETTDQYPPTYTQKQIDDEKAKKRKTKLELAVRDMKEGYNVPWEIETPISVRLDTGKKYWIGIDNSGVKVSRDNYIKVFHSGNAGPEIGPGFISDAANTWKEYQTLWFKTFYPRHEEAEGKRIMSGSTLSDFGNGRMVYRYQFSGQDSSSVSGFPGRKIFDMYEGNFASSDANGNYLLSGPDQYAIYKFDTFYPVRKIILRDILYHKSIGIDFSNDGENWKEILWENPAENNQKIDPVTINSEGDDAVFYLRIKPAGEECTLINFSLEAELEGCGSSGCLAAAQPEPEILSEPDPQEEIETRMLDVVVYNGSDTKGLAGAIAEKISVISQLQVIKKANAKGYYDGNIIVDITGDNGDKIEEIAASIGGETGTLPDGEEKPDADILVIGAGLEGWAPDNN